ncbi:hypothetical protein LB524_21400 [Mesorhizobium sp. ESP6-5]|uniref:hypothetical protein n=1 Tax=Mesorhizobium sp. ESP6-5 TaxID=2876623 RepID=UPI001CCE51A5|nr:hypothetical protein [Mesorhizobium sp. ESP6-5]MBZ9757846.1 hypothetical protein [Mesorhizobium sp. ESP6-5]
MTSHYLPQDQWTALVDALVEARGDHDARNAVIVALAEVGFIVPDTCREDEPAPLAA